MLVGPVEKDGYGLILYQCPECGQQAGNLINLYGHPVSDLKRVLEIDCSACGKEIIVEIDS